MVSHSNRGQTAGWQFDSFSTSGQSGAPASTLRFGVFNSNGTLFSPADISLPDDQLTHIAGTFDGSTVKVYRNGDLAGEAEFSAAAMVIAAAFAAVTAATLALKRKDHRI